ncbi:MAG: hypothetical protein IJ068_01855, partial [Bacilli bacterium]|nr:hypothetical protein [Bacilli bacterium]
KGDDLMKKVVQEVKEISGKEEPFRFFTDEELLEMDRKQFREEGFAEGLAEGREKGLAEGRVLGLAEGHETGRLEAQHEMIINMHNNGVSLDLICKSTKLSLDEIKKIIKIH